LVAAQLVDQVKFTQVLEFAFHNPLIRAVAYEAHLRSDRADLHRRVAAAIEQQSGGSADENAALIAEHLAAAGDLQAAYEWHIRAGTWLNNRDIAAARVSWDRARQAADALPDDHLDRTAMRITPRTALCATDWRVHADDSIVRSPATRPRWRSASWGRWRCIYSEARYTRRNNWRLNRWRCSTRSATRP
jgi:hypothetical protein